MGSRGPKRQTGKREPNGRLARDKASESARRTLKADKADWDTMSVAIDVRHRLHKIALVEALDQRAGSLVGRMVMAKELTVAQGDAASKYIEDLNNYRQAIAAPRQPGAVDLNAVRGGGQSGPDHVAFVRRSLERYCGPLGSDGRRNGGVKRVLEDASARNRGENIFAAIEYLVLRDEYHAHLVGALKIGLSALAVFYGMTVEVAA